MNQTDSTRPPTTGWAGLDEVLCGLRLGDNVVWEVESLPDFSILVTRFLAHALHGDRRICYFRFARHAPILDSSLPIEIVELDPQAGFETFLGGIHEAADRAGPGAYHVFDSLSDLTADWYSDQMVGNFFQLTCPYLFDLDTVAYFALLRSFHSIYALGPIAETTQLLLEAYRKDDKLYVHPLKVDRRSSPRMYMLHEIDGDDVRQVTDSATISEILSSSSKSTVGLLQHHIGVWTRTFVKAETLLEEQREGTASDEQVERMKMRLLRMAISRDKRVLELADRFLTLSDLVAIGKRMLGTGLVGGKSVGMLVARAILCRSNPRWRNLLEMHDSFYIPADVFYTFLLRNGCWEIRKQLLKTPDNLHFAREAHDRIMAGAFPPHIEKRFIDMLDYYGQSPIIVRSSSLLEDNFGNSFAGKYESIFCANQGPRQERLTALVNAVKQVYASALSRPALEYRERFGLLDRDEQMALLVQRVSGAHHGPYHFPQIAGVGFSFNPYVWNEQIDPEAGMLRLVFGLGTRAVDRSDDDYTRLIALNAPDRRPESNSGEASQHAQRKIDVIDLAADDLRTVHFDEVSQHAQAIPMQFFSARDPELARRARQEGRAKPPLMLRFDGLIKKTPFVDDMRDMLRTLEDAYGVPVDTEFTANFDREGNYRVNLVQCRPLQIKDGASELGPLPELRKGDLFLRSSGPVIGRSRLDRVDRVIYVVPRLYGQLPVTERYAVARLIGRLNRVEKESGHQHTVMLLGPGRWGTTTPSLGVPVAFAEINTAAILCEVVAMRDDLVPDVSFGTHFFSELVEMDMLYMALFPSQDGSVLSPDFFEKTPNKLTQLLPDAGDFEEMVRVFDPAEALGNGTVWLRADTLKQQALCYHKPS